MLTFPRPPTLITCSTFSEYFLPSTYTSIVGFPIKVPQPMKSST